MTVKELQKHDIAVDEKQAKTILDFLYLLADNTVQSYFNEVDCPKGIESLLLSYL